MSITSSRLYIRRAQPWHASRLSSLFTQSVAEDFQYFTPEYREQLLRQHTRRSFVRALMSPDSVFFIIKDEVGQVMGYNLIRRQGRESAFLHWMYIQPDWRGQGHGQAIVKAALGHLNRRGVKDLRLVTHNKMDFYQQLGFTIIPASLKSGGVTMSVMHYQLDDSLILMEEV